HANAQRAAYDAVSGRMVDADSRRAGSVSDRRNQQIVRGVAVLRSLTLPPRQIRMRITESHVSFARLMLVCGVTVLWAVSFGIGTQATSHWLKLHDASD